MWGCRVVALLVVGLNGCSDLETLEPGVCGNGVLESGEDCDAHADPALGPGVRCASPTSATQACRYVCEEGAACPLGWACRPDRVCHHGTGALVRVAGSRSGPATADWHVGDLDGDGAADVVGAAAGEVRGFFADGTGSFGPALHRALPLGSASALALGDLDGDGRDDVVALARRGLVVLRGTEDRTLEPVAYSQFGVPGDWIVPLHVHGVRPEDSLLVPFDDGDDAVFLIVVTSGTEVGSFSAVPGHSISDLGGRLPIADLDGDGDDEVLLAFAGDDELFVGSTRRDLDDGELDFAWRTREVALPGRRIAAGGLFADLDADGAMDLLVSVEPEEPSGVGKAMRCLAAGAGAFAEAEEDRRFDAADWPLAAGDLDGDGAADFVLPTGLVRSTGLETSLAAFDTAAPAVGARWKEAIVLDLDQDGALDVVATEADEPVLHVLRMTDLHAPARVDLPTRGEPVGLRIGDFNADQVPDVAYRSGADGIEVVFGVFRDWPDPPVFVGRVEGLDRLEAGYLRDLDGNFDPASDLLVGSESEADGPVVAAFGGAASRVLDSPFALAPLTGGPSARALAAAVGRFLPRRDGAEGTRDLLALAVGGTLGSPALWLLPGAPAARFRRDDRVAQDASPELLRRLGPECGVWAVGDVDGDGLDEAVAVGPRAGCAPASALPPDAAPALLVVDAAVAAGAEGPTVAVTLVQGVQPPRARGLQVGDLDGDGRADLLLESDEVAVVWAGPAGLDGATMQALPTPGGALLSASAVQADADAPLELALLTAAGEVWLAEREGRDFRLGEAAVARAEGTTLRAGDVDGDGLLDLVVSSGDAWEVLRVRSHLEPP